MGEEIREEFEAWLSVFLSDADIEDIASARAVDTDGSTVYFFPDDDESTMGITAMWMGWQASRANLMVELPESRGADEYMGFTRVIREADIESAFEAAGIKVKS